MYGFINLLITLLITIMLVFFCEKSVFAQEAQTATLPVADTQSAAETGAAVETLTLEAAINLALKSNRSIQNAEIETDKAFNRTAAYKTRRLPSFKVSTLFSQPLTSVDFTFEKGVFGTYDNTGPIPNNDVKITSDRKPTALVIGQVQQPLTQLFRLNLNIKQLELSEEITREQTRQQRQDVVADIKRVYYDIIQTESAAKSLEETTKLYDELERVTKNHVIQQAALKTDLMDVQARKAKVEYEMLTLKNALLTRKEELNNLLGRDVRTEFNVSTTLETAQFLMRETNLPSAQEKALEQRPEVKQARLKYKQAQLDTRAKKSELIPDVSLNFNYLSPFSYSDVLPKNVMSIGVNVEWEVFDWGRKKREIKEKKSAEKQADNTLRDVENATLIEVSSRYRKLQESCRLLQVTRMSQETAKGNLQVVAYRYGSQAVLLKDVLQAQAALADANHQYQKALTAFWTAKADFEKAIGEEK